SFAQRGAILMWAGRAAEALPWIQGALRLDRTNARAAFYLGTTYYLRSGTESLQTLRWRKTDSNRWSPVKRDGVFRDHLDRPLAPSPPRESSGALAGGIEGLEPVNGNEKRGAQADDRY